MSQENVERWRAVIDGFFAAAPGSDWEQWLTDIAADFIHPEIVWDASDFPVPDLGGVFRGAPAVVEWWRQWLAAWQTVEFKYELVDAGDQVVLLLDQRMRGRSTAIEVALGEYAHVGTFRDGRMVRWEVYSSQSKALKAAGLSD